MSRRDRRRDPLLDRPSRSEIDEELEHHLEGRVQELIASGLDPDEAEREARRLFGNPRRARRDIERIYGSAKRAGPAELLGELAGAFRTVRRRPAFSVTAVLLIAIGIGATTALLAVVDAYLLTDLPFPAAERLLRLNRIAPERREPGPPPPPVDWREVAEVELDVSWDLDAFTLVGDGPPEQVLGSWVPRDYFEAFGIRPAMGRGFTQAETEEGAPVAVISHELWQSRFAGDAAVLGRTFRMYASDRPDEASALTIIGVLPADYWSPDRFSQILTPLPGARVTYLVRLAEGVSRERALAAMSGHAAEVWGPEFSGWRLELETLHERHVRSVRPILGALAATIGLVLLIACANVGMLLVVQASGRTREFAVRAALGAGRGRLAMRLLAEALWIGVAGAALGWLAAGYGLTVFGQAIESQLGTAVPGGAELLAIDPRVALMSGAITLVTTLLFGLAPMIAGLGPGQARHLSGSGRSSTQSRRQRLLRTGLIVAELALSLALLAGAGLMLRSTLHLSGVDPGFTPDGLLRAELGLSSFRYPEPADWTQLVDETLEELAGTPGVEGVAAAMPPPLAPGFDAPAEAMDGDGEPTPTALRRISPGYLDTVGVALLAGRGFDGRDTAGSEPVALVGERLAERLWPDGGAVGASLRVDPDPMRSEGPVWHRVVGVVGEVREGVTDEDEAADVYVPLAQAPMRYVYLLVRSTRAPELLVPELEERIWRRDPEQPLTAPMTMRQLMLAAGSTPRALARLLSGFAIFGLLLAVIGVYGVIAFAVRERRREIAVRIALGADGTEIGRLVVRHGLGIVGAGVGIGLATAWATARALASQIHGVRANDPVTLAVVAVLLGAVSLLGVALPARRAARTDPMDLLREE